ncbi:hypothetical protein JCM33374_g1524 [Metschnikowia sp. JCM 33374]|nr:hypothetical protein JCM33374_g1524 [Metschnikowia sp. JCM 33374]
MDTDIVKTHVNNAETPTAVGMEEQQPSETGVLEASSGDESIAREDSRGNGAEEDNASQDSAAQTDDGGDKGAEQDDEQDDEEDDDYDPESAFAVPEPAIMETAPYAITEPASDSESSYEPELPPSMEEATTEQVTSKVQEHPAINDTSAQHEETSGNEVSKTTPSTGSNPTQTPDKSQEDSFNTPTSDKHGQEQDDQQQQEEEEEEEEEEEDDYDPEKSLLPEAPIKGPAPSLPPKPAAHSGQQPPQVPVPDLKEAYEAVMSSEVVRSDHFAQLSKEKQMEVIQALLHEKQIPLPGVGVPSANNSAPTSTTFPSVQLQTSPVAQTQTPLNDNNGSGRPDISLPMTEEENQAYEEFLSAEEQFLSSGEELPENSRLFVGNLPTNTIKKQDLFRLFRRYGELVELSIKTGYGFAQFKTAEACAACMKGESEMPLHNRLLRLDASHRRKNTQDKNTQDSPGAAGRGRERSSENGFQESEPKRLKSDIKDVDLIVTNQTKDSLVAEVEDALHNGNLTHSLKTIGDEDPADEIREAAYSGVIGACVLKDEKVDLQIFEETGDGGVKFDEYLDIDAPAACEIIVNAKKSRSQKVDEPHKKSPPRREERIPKFKKGHNNIHNNGFQDGRRRGFPDKPPSNFGYNDRHRGPGKHSNHGHQNGWQRNQGFPGRNGWDSRSSNEAPYNSYSGQGYQGRGSGYNAPPYNQALGFNNGQFGADQNFDVQAGNQGYPNQGYPNQGYPNQGYPSHNQGYPNHNQGYHNQGYPDQGYNRNNYQNGGGFPGNSRQDFRGPSHGSPMNFENQPGFSGSQPSQPTQADPALLQTLQNLDPNTMRSVVALLQQQQGGAAGASQGPGNPAYSNAGPAPNYEQSSPSAQVNSLLAQLQSQPTPSAAQFTHQSPQLSQQAQQSPQQPYNSASSQQANTNPALMDMLSRLEGQ